MRRAVPSQPHLQQLHLALFVPHEICAWEYEQRRRRLRRQQQQEYGQRRSRLRSDSATRGLFDSQQTPAERCDAWSDRAVEQLHEAVLHQSLRSLQARGSGAEKRDILQWIFAPQPMVAVLRDARGKPFEAVLPQSLTPFSFEQCCRICGYSAERLRDGLMPLLRERGLGSFFNEIANGSKQHETGGDPQALQDPRHLQHAAGLGCG